MILKNLNTELLEGVRIDELNLCLIPDHFSFKHINFAQYDGVVIQSNNSGRTKQILFALRSSDNPQIYLKPIFTDSKKIFSRFKNDIDELMTERNKQLIHHKAKKINDRIVKISRDISKVKNVIDKFILKGLQYSYTRENSFHPYRTRFSSIGYSYPFINLIASSEEHLEITKKLGALHKKSYLKKELLDKINLCHSCMSSYLNFHETCSKCGSIDLSYENLIHHFRCAYIGPESDFIKGDHLECPKCSKELKHIGIDYDKPSEIAHCNSCDHQSQETQMQATCVDCGTDNTISQISTYEVFGYQLNEAGKAYIRGESSENDMEQEELRDLKIVPLPIFDLLCSQEKERIKTNRKISSFKGSFTIKDEVFKYLNETSKILFKEEVLSILKNHLRPLDILCAKNHQSYLFLFPEITKKEAIQYYETILDNLNKVLQDNLNDTQLLVQGHLAEL